MALGPVQALAPALAAGNTGSCAMVRGAKPAGGGLYIYACVCESASFAFGEVPRPLPKLTGRALPDLPAEFQDGHNGEETIFV